jgi:hypothetical protein
MTLWPMMICSNGFNSTFSAMAVISLRPHRERLNSRHPEAS